MSRPGPSLLRDQGGDLRRLRWLLLGVLLALLVPTTILAGRAYNQLGYESLHRYRLTAENIAQSIESGLLGLLATELAHDVAQYTFFLPQTDTATEQTVSPLAQLGSEHELPGEVGHFLISATGRLQTPLLPASVATTPEGLLSAEQILQRQLRRQLMNELVASLALEPAAVPPKVVTNAPRDAVGQATGGLLPEVLADAEFAAISEEAEARSEGDMASATDSQLPKNANQQVFERLARLKSKREQKAAPVASDDAIASSFSLNQGYLRRQRAPDSALRGAPEVAPTVAQDAAAGGRFDWFMRNDGVLQYLPVGDAHLLLYRRSWQTGTPVILGLILERQALFAALVDEPFLAARDNANLRLTLANGERALRSVAGTSDAYSTSKALQPRAGGELLYRARLPAPFSDLQLVFSATQVGIPPGGAWIVGSSALLIALLLASFALIYWFGAREIARRATQQNFVSAVSHELKTPLTAIRMYGEMLKSGWVPEEKKPGYYDFIFAESERLSRLISNVLRLSQVSRDRLALSLEPHSAAELMDIARSKLQSLADSGSVDLVYELPENLAEAMVIVDLDALAQVLINLVDNAIKFRGAGTDQRVVIELKGQPTNLPGDRRELSLSVRDFGPGIPKAQLGRIFDLFYRGDDAVADQTQGTGIGLALVAELVAGMNGTVTAANVDPGARFSVHLPITV